jgi:TatD DNase family protein
MFIDTHCHLNIIAPKQPLEPLQEHHFPAIDQAITEAALAGVKTIINVGTDLIESAASVMIAQRYKGVFATVGVHPTDCNELPQSTRDTVQALRSWLLEKEHNKIVGVGEIGLDFYHKPYDEQKQKDYCRAQIELALAHKLPVVIHVREAADEMLRLLEEYVKQGLRGVLHCFQQQQYVAEQACGWGLMIGLDAPINYPKNAWLREVFKQVPLEHIVLETDAPFLPPQAMRGKQNKPAYIPLIAQELAMIKAVDVAVIEQQTTANARQLFNLKY